MKIFSFLGGEVMQPGPLPSQITSAPLSQPWSRLGGQYVRFFQFEERKQYLLKVVLLLYSRLKSAGKKVTTSYKYPPELTKAINGQIRINEIRILQSNLWKGDTIHSQSIDYSNISLRKRRYYLIVNVSNVIRSDYSL